MIAIRSLAAFLGALLVVLGPAAAQERPAVRVAVVPAADAVPFFYAVHSGMFARAGLDVTYQQMANGGTIAAAIAGNAADVGFSNVQTLIVAHAKGIPFTILAPGGVYSDDTPTTALLVLADSPVRAAKDLEGRSVAVGALQDLQALSVSVWMSANGADPARVRFIESPASAAPAMLQQHRVDAIVVSEPNLQKAQAAGARVLGKPYGAIAKRLLVSGWYATQGWTAAHRDAAQRFGEVMRRASAYANAHRDEMDALIADYAKIPPETLKAMAHAHAGTMLAPGELQVTIDAAARYKVIGRAFPAAELLASTS